MGKMIHIVFRENGVAINNAQEVEKIANALVNVDYKGNILSYVEFQNPQQMLAFFKLLKLVEMVGDVNSLEESIMKLKKEYEVISDILNKELSKKIIIEYNGTTTEASLQTLLSGITYNNNYIQLQIDGEKIKLTLKHS